MTKLQLKKTKFFNRLFILIVFVFLLLILVHSSKEISENSFCTEQTQSSVFLTFEECKNFINNQN